MMLRPRFLFVLKPPQRELMCRLFHKVHIGTEEMAEFGEELLALLDDI